MLDDIRARIEAEIEQLTHELTVVLPHTIKTAVEHGDLRENADYKSAVERQQFVQARTDGFEALREHLKEYAPEKMAEVCGIDAETLRTVARVYATSEASIVFWGMGVSQHTHGTDNARCLIDLALITGQVGRPGTGLHPLRGQNNVQGASDAGLIPMVLPDYQPVGDAQVRAAFEELWNTDLDDQPGLTVVEIMDAIAAGTIKGMYIQGENPAMSDPDLDHARAALAKLEHLVVQDLFVTETAQFADVILPASAWPEKDGSVTNTNRQLHTLKGTVGRTKVEVMAERCRLINPRLEIATHEVFYEKTTSDRLLPAGEAPDFVVDAIDNITAKCHLLATCRELGIPVVCSTGASGRFDPTCIQVGDLAKTKVDPLARDVRKILRNQYNFPTGKRKFQIPAVFSTEEPAQPQELTYDNGEGFRCVCPGGSNGMHSCEKRSVIYGTAGFVTGTFGMVCASVVVKSLVSAE